MVWTFVASLLDLLVGQQINVHLRKLLGETALRRGLKLSALGRWELQSFLCDIVFISEVQGPPIISLQKRLNNTSLEPKDFRFWILFSTMFGSQFMFLIVLTFLSIFGIVFEKLTAIFLKILRSFQGPCCSHFDFLSADAAKHKWCNHLDRNVWFGRCWASVFAWFLANSLHLVCCSLDGIFVQFLWIWPSKADPCWGLFSQILRNWHAKKRAEIEAWKIYVFGSNLEGPADEGGVCSDSAEHGGWPQSRPAPPCGGAANLKGDALCRQPPLLGRELRGGGCVVRAELLCWV